MSRNAIVGAFLALALGSPLLSAPISVEIDDRRNSNNGGTLTIGFVMGQRSVFFRIERHQNSPTVAPAFTVYNPGFMVPGSETYTVTRSLGQSTIYDEAIYVTGSGCCVHREPYNVSLSMVLHIGPWTGGTVTSHHWVQYEHLVPFRYEVIGGNIADFVGMVELRDAAGQCLFCERIVGGTGTVNSGFLTNETSAGGYDRYNRYVLNGFTGIPEPSTIGLVGIAGVAGLILSRARRRGQKGA